MTDTLTGLRATAEGATVTTKAGGYQYVLMSWDASGAEWDCEGVYATLGAARRAEREMDGIEYPPTRIRRVFVPPGHEAVMPRRASGRRSGRVTAVPTDDPGASAADSRGVIWEPDC